MSGKIHPYWFIPSTNAPFTYRIKSYGIRGFVTDPENNTVDMNWHVKYTVKANNRSLNVVPNQVDIKSDVFLTITFHEKVSQIKLIEQVFKSGVYNEQNLLLHRENTINCYYLDSFNDVKTISILDGSLRSNVLDQICKVKTLSGSPQVKTELKDIYGYLYLCRGYRHHDVWTLVIDPHVISTNLDYDFVLIKFIRYDDVQSNYVFDDKAIISNTHYYPMGWLENNFEYWVLLNKHQNERLYFVRKGGYYGIGIREIHYLKLK